MMCGEKVSKGSTTTLYRTREERKVYWGAGGGRRERKTHVLYSVQSCIYNTCNIIERY